MTNKAAAYRKPNDNAEVRFLVNNFELRSEGEGEENKIRKARGYAALFNSQTNMGYYDETILPGAFDECLSCDVRALFNHDSNMVLGRGNNSTGTLKYGVDTRGLWFEVDLDPAISFHADLIKMMERGDVNQCSFAFQIKEQSWVQTEQGQNNIRKILKVKELYDVSVVTYPAYQDTDVALRSMREQFPEVPDTLSSVDVKLRLRKRQMEMVA